MFALRFAPKGGDAGHNCLTLRVKHDCKNTPPGPLATPTFLSFLFVGSLMPEKICSISNCMRHKWDGADRQIPWHNRHVTPAREQGIMGHIDSLLLAFFNFCLWCCWEVTLVQELIQAAHGLSKFIL